MPTEQILQQIKEKHPEFDSTDTIRRALNIIWSLDNSSKDYADGDYNASDLYEQLCDMRYAFESVLELIVPNYP